MAKTYDLPAGPTPVAWMYSHPEFGSQSSVHTIRKDAFHSMGMEQRGWTETPLSPTSLVTDLLEALREARDQLWHLAKDPNDNPLLCQIDAAIAKAEGRS